MQTLIPTSILVRTAVADRLSREYDIASLQFNSGRQHNIFNTTSITLSRSEGHDSYEIGKVS